MPEGRKLGLLLKELSILDFRSLECFLSLILEVSHWISFVFLYLFLLIPQEAEAKAAAAEERERSVNERLSQTLSRINVLEAQVLQFIE